MARSVSTRTWFENAIRVGLAAYGIMHILIGWLGLQLAFGDRQGAPNQQGALHILAQQPGCAVLLWITGLGLFVLSLWQLLEALWGHTKDKGGMRALERIGSVGKVVLYAVLGYSAIKTAAAGSSITDEHSLTRKLLQLPVGQLIVMAIGAVIVAVAAILAHRGLTTSFDKRLRPGIGALSPLLPPVLDRSPGPSIAPGDGVVTEREVRRVIATHVAEPTRAEQSGRRLLRRFAGLRVTIDNQSRPARPDPARPGAVA